MDTVTTVIATNDVYGAMNQLTFLSPRVYYQVRGLLEFNGDIARDLLDVVLTVRADTIGSSLTLADADVYYFLKGLQEIIDA